MKRKLKLNLLGAGLFFAWVAIGSAQSAFTKITEGAIVSDLGTFTGAAWGDFNNDGFLDVFLSQYGGRNVFYRNNGQGTFTRITEAAPVEDEDAHTIPSWGDYDNDGWLDLLVPAGLLANQSTHASLYHNAGGGILSKASGGSLTTEAGYFAGGWVDYDNDGFLDVFLSNIESDQGGTSLLFHNNRDGTFSAVPSSPLTTDVSVPFAHLWADYDNDGFPDLFIVSHQSNRPNLLYHNNRDGTFVRVLTGPISTDRGAEYSIGGAWGDYDNDGFSDLFVATSQGGPNRLYRNNGNGTLVKVTSGLPLSKPADADSTTAAWGDYDNDGFLDLFVSSVDAKNVLFHNNGNGTFTRVTAEAPAEDGGRGVSCAGSSWVDYDNDGFLDLFVLEGADDGSPLPNLLYHNNGNANGWLEVKCIGTSSNRSGLGAKVRVRATIQGKTIWQMREISAAAGYNTSPPIAHFGLGDAPLVEALRVEWPSGIVQELREIAPKQILFVTEPVRIEPRLGGVAGMVELNVKSWSGFDYGVDASTDLLNWTRIARVTPFSTTLRFSDPGARSSDHRFYRIVSP